MEVQLRLRIESGVRWRFLKIKRPQGLCHQLHLQGKMHGYDF